MDSSNDKNLRPELPDFEYKESAVNFWRNCQPVDGKLRRKSHDFETVRQKFPIVKSLSQLYEWEHAVKNRGTRFDKLKMISKHVHDKFKIAVADRKTVRDKDLREWALEANEEVKLKNFVASRSWILMLKRSWGIMLRNINKAAKTENNL